jgi:hypothetical protein
VRIVDILKLSIIGLALLIYADEILFVESGSAGTGVETTIVACVCEAFGIAGTFVFVTGEEVCYSA